MISKSTKKPTLVSKELRGPSVLDETKEKPLNLEEMNSEDLARELKKLDQRLQKTYVKHNELIAKNKDLKEEIDALRKERKIYEDLYVQLDSELTSKTKYLEELKKESINAMNEKEKVEKQLASLRAQAKREENDLEKEFQAILWELNEKNIQDKVIEKFGSVVDGRRMAPCKPIFKDYDYKDKKDTKELDALKETGMKIDGNANSPSKVDFLVKLAYDLGSAWRR